VGINLPNVRRGRWEILLTHRACTDIWKAPIYMPKAVLKKDLPRKRLKHFLFSPTYDTNSGFRHRPFTSYDKRKSDIQSSAVCVSRTGNDNVKVKINRSRQRTRTYDIVEGVKVPLLYTPCCDASLKVFPLRRDPPGPVCQISSRTTRPDRGTCRVVRSIAMCLNMRGGALAVGAPSSEDDLS
jgi:hypothetical protein